MLAFFFRADDNEPSLLQLWCALWPSKHVQGTCYVVRCKLALCIVLAASLLSSARKVHGNACPSAVNFASKHLIFVVVP